MTPAAAPAGDRGSASLELVVIAPAFILVVAVLIFGGRLAFASGPSDPGSLAT